MTLVDVKVGVVITLPGSAVVLLLLNWRHSVRIRKESRQIRLELCDYELALVPVILSAILISVRKCAVKQPLLLPLLLWTVSSPAGLRNATRGGLVLITTAS